MVFVRFQRFSICLLLSLTRSFFNNMDPVDYWWFEKCDFYRDQTNNK